MIEKAYKKLRLDALVIQQGRLTENTKTVNKDDLLSMVRYGAEMVFSSSVRAQRHGLQPTMTRNVAICSLLFQRHPLKQQELHYVWICLLHARGKFMQSDWCCAAVWSTQ